MDVIDRYLQAVKWWLPRDQKEDVVAELGADLRAQVEERETELGRTLEKKEVEAFLVRCGRPNVAAARYLPQRHLIGPAWFPTYLLALKASALFYLVPWVVVWLGLFLFAPSFRAENPGLTILSGWASFWEVALFAFAVITLVFAGLDRAQEAGKLEWSPRRLPPVRDARHISRVGSAFEIAIQSAFLSWWTSLPRDWFGPARIPALRDAFHEIRVPVALLTLASLALGVLNFARPYWTPSRRALRAAVSLGAAAVAFAFLTPRWPEFLADAHRLAAHANGAILADPAAAVVRVTFGVTALGIGVGSIVAFAVDGVRALLARDPASIAGRGEDR